MSAAAVEAALARLREAGHALRERSPASVHEALADVLDAWSAPGSTWQKELAGLLPGPTGFSPEVVSEGLASGLAPYTGAALHDLVRAEIGDGAASMGFEVTASVLAGAIPLPTFVAVLAPLALRSPVLIKPSAHDPVTATAIKRSLAERDALLGACVEVADFRRDDAAALDALCATPCVAAMGSDAAVAAIAARARRAEHFLGSGHRFSIAAVGREATRGEALARAAHGVARDVALWDQLGCLSPVSVLVADADAGAANRVAEALAKALADAERRWPRGRIGAETAAAIARERAVAELRAAAGQPVAVLASRDTAWTVVREADAMLGSAPLHRFVRVHPAPHFVGTILDRAAHLAGVAIAGFGAATDSVTRELLALGASRVCEPGALQTPPLAWQRDMRPVLRSLARGVAID